MLEYKQEYYGPYKDLVEKGYQKINLSTIDDSNIDYNFNCIINILSDGIETDYVQHMKLRCTFADNVTISLSIMDYMFNLLLWSLVTCSGNKIYSYNLYFEKAVTQRSIKKWIDRNFLVINMTLIPIIKLNQLIDRSIGKFRDLVNFQMYLANTLNLKDTIDLMKKYPEFNDSIHFDATGIPLEDVKEEGMKAMRIQMKYIKESDHCLRDAFLTGEGVNPKQAKEVNVNIGPKPNGLGSVFPHAINHSFINGGLQSVEDVVMDSSIGRLAQMMKKQNVGDSGAFARNLGLNCMDTRIHPDPEYSCDTKNLQIVEIKNSDILDMFNMRWYKTNPKGVLHLLDATRDKHLIGQTLYFRSPMTCASAARGEGICYKCYGNLAYVNNDINIGQIATELLSAIYTQRLLSAKHLLEAAIVKLEWQGNFYNIFSVEFNQITLKDINYRGMYMKIDSDEIVIDEKDDSDDFNLCASKSYITQFTILYPDGSSDIIKTLNYDELFLHENLMNIISNIEPDEDGFINIELSKLKDLSLFEMDVKNDELSKTMKAIHNIINNKTITRSFDRNSILMAFIDNNLSGGIKLNSVHFEVILMNQIYNAEDNLLLPNWRNENEPYQIVPLDTSLKNNRNISIRLQSNVSKTVTSPDNHKLKHPSIVDMFAMKRPQDFMSQIPLSDYKLIGEDSVKKEAIYFKDKN